MHSSDPTAPVSVEPSLSDSLARAATVEQCLEVAAQAEATGDPALLVASLERAIAHDRQCHVALLNLAAIALEQGDRVSTFSLLEETARLAPLPAEVEPLRRELWAELSESPQLATYRQLIGRQPVAPAEPRRSVLVVTAELASSGAEPLRELALGLIARGHEVRVLTAEATPLGADDAALELRVLRTLQTDQVSAGAQVSRDNAARIRTAVTKSQADLVLAGDLRGLGFALLQPAFERGTPVLHWQLATRPGFGVEAMPADPLYTLAAASEWGATALRNAGYETARMPVLAPGVALPQWFRFFLPDPQRLRVATLAPVAAGSGLEELVRALGRLRAAGLAFTAELGGELVDAAHLATLQQLAQEAGLTEVIHFQPALDRAARQALFARANVFVSPTPRAEAFARSELEAMASGLVVLTTGLGGARELVRDGLDGLQIAVSDDAGLAAQLQRLATEPELMMQLQRQGQARATGFALEQSVRQFEASLEDLHTAAQASLDPALAFTV